MKIKRCSDCGRFLGEDHFGWLNKTKGYRQPYCKRCNSNRYYLWKLDNKDHIKKYQKEWYEKNKERVKKCVKNWCAENQGHKKEYNKQWYADNREYRKEYLKQWYAENIEHRLEYQRQWQADNPEYKKQWQKENRDKIYSLNSKRRAMKLNQTPDLTIEEMEHIKSIYKFCNELNSHFGEKSFHVDHIQPLSKGGFHTGDNLQIIPTSQNLAKGSKCPKKFYGRYYDFIVGKKERKAFFENWDKINEG